MRFISFKRAGVASYGLVRDGMVADLGATGGAPADLKDAITAGALASLAAAATPAIPLADVDLLPIIPNPSRILCVGHNYEDHRQETGRAKTAHPSIFTRFADTQIGAGAPILRPAESTMLDYEGELLVVIGRGGRRIPRAAAWDHIAGYACANDGSVRDWQWHTSQFTPGKNFPATCPSGPWMVTPDEMGPIGAQSLTTRLNGVVVQQARLDRMIFGLDDIIAYCSTFCTLHPGDLILTGTPGGVGAKREPPLWMTADDTVDVTIDGIGTLSSRVRDEHAGGA